MGRQRVSIKGDTDGSYRYVVVHLVATVVLAVTIASVAWGVLFTAPGGTQMAHAQHSAGPR